MPSSNMDFGLDFGSTEEKVGREKNTLTGYVWAEKVQKHTT